MGSRINQSGRGDGRKTYRPSKCTYKGRSAGGVLYPNSGCDAFDQEDDFGDSSKDYKDRVTEDNRISRQIRRLTRETNGERFLDTILTLKENIHAVENLRYVKRHPYIYESLFDILSTAPDKSCKWAVAICLGHVGKVIGFDTSRFLEDCFAKLSRAPSSEQKVLILRSIYTMCELESDPIRAKLPVVGKIIADELHSILETTDNVEVMVITVNIMKLLHTKAPKAIAAQFQDIVDILVGWHIDYSQHEDVTTYVSLSLQSFQKTWANNVHMARTLLTQFLEDLEDYLLDPVEECIEDPVTSSHKVASFIGVFTTILRCLGPNIDPTSFTEISEAFLLDSLQKIMKVVKKVYGKYPNERILLNLSHFCVSLLCLKVIRISSELLDLIEMHSEAIRKFRFSTQIGLLHLIRQSLIHLDETSVLSLTKVIMQKNSVLSQLRTSIDKETWNNALKVYHTLFARKSVSVLQEAYQYVLVDFEESLKVLVPHARSFAQPVSGYTYDSVLTEEEAIEIFDYSLAVVSELANTRNSIITLWALEPSIVELLAIHLNPSDGHWATHYPSLQENIVHLLYAHCKEHSQFISSSTLVVGKPAGKFIPAEASFSVSESFQSSTSTSNNLDTILSLITSLLKLKNTASVTILSEALEWAAITVIGCDQSSPRLLGTPQFTNLLSCMVDLTYHFMVGVKKSSASALLMILKTIPCQQIHCTKDIVHTCFYHCSHADADIRKCLLKILSLIPLSKIYLAIRSKETTQTSYSITKDGSDCQLELGHLNSKNLLHLQRHYFMHTSLEVSGVSFYTISRFLLQNIFPQDKNWMENIFSVSQRIERLAEAEDWSFSILVSNFKVLLWKWICWESVHYCTANRLKTCLGKPTDMFNSILEATKKHCAEISRTEDSNGDNSELKDPNYLFKVVLLVEFIECLEKALFNASDGCAVIPPPTNKSVRVFFSTNRQTCIEWMFCLRAAVITVAQNTGQLEVALRHSYALLEELSNNPKTKEDALERAVCYCVKVLCNLGCEEAIMGFHSWMLERKHAESNWIKFAALCAGKRYEEALSYYEEYNLASDFKSDSEKSDGTSHYPFIQEFLHEQVYLCDKSLENWNAIIAGKEVRYGPLTELGSPPFIKDFSHIEALSKFPSDGIPIINATSLPNIQSKKSWIPSENAVLLDGSLLHCLSKTFHVGSLDSESLDILEKSKDEVENLLKVLTVTDNHYDQLDAFATLHFINQLEGSSKQSELCEDWNGCQFESPLLLNRISRYMKLMAKTLDEPYDRSIVNLDLLRSKISRKNGNFIFAQSTLTNLLKWQGSDFALVVQSHLEHNETSIIDAKIYRESAKLIFWTGETGKSLGILSETVCRLNEILQTLASQDPSLLSLPPNDTGDICARSLITINKWLITHKMPDISLYKLLEVYENMKQYAPPELSIINDETLASLPITNANIGRFYMLGAIQCPNLAKIWYNMASWAFKWGQTLLSSRVSHEKDLDDVNALRIKTLLQDFFTPDTIDSRFQEISDIINNGYGAMSEKSCQEYLWLGDEPGMHQLESALYGKFYEWGIESDAALPYVTKILHGGQDVIQSGHIVLRAAAAAYFRFLRTSDEKQSQKLDRQMTATLRLLRIIVKHATEMQDVLEAGLENTPTNPWKSIIPQLFARLSHQEPYIRGSISSLLCRIAQDSPHLIIFPAVVGASGSINTTQKTWTGVMDKYFNKNNLEESTNSGESAEVSSEEEDVEEDPIEPVKSIEEQLDDDEGDFEQTDVNSQEEIKKRTLMQNCFSNLVNTLQNQLGGSIAEVRTFIHELRRITVLWDELWIGTLSPHLSDLNKKCQQLKSDIVKLNQNSSLSMTQKEELAHKKYDIVFKPVIFVLDQLMAITSAPPETPHEASFQENFHPLIQQTRDALSQPGNILEPNQSLSKLKGLYQALQHKSHKKSSSTLNMMDISPVLAKMTNTKIAMPGSQSTSSEILCISSVGSTINILPTKTKPKKLSFQGSDGRKHTYLFKGLEDLHLDQRIMQFLATVNTMFHHEKSSVSKMYRARFYSVVPLGARSGLIQWVDNATPLFGLYKRWQQREGQLKALEASNPKQVIAQMVHRPSEIFFNKLTPKLKELGISVENRKAWPLATLKEVYEELVKETAKDLLSREMWMTSVNAKEWWVTTQTYNISSAVMSVIGYVIGLGDRHLDNLLVNLTTGEVIHIDYNVCFEKGRNLRIPETVPFRMTQNIEHALGVTGVEGIFRSTCEEVLQTMRFGKETLLTLLEAFIYDPLIDWTPDNEAGYAGAIYGGEQTFAQEVKENRLQLEKSLTLSMLEVRLTEMKAEWLANKEDVSMAIPQVIDDIGLWKTTYRAMLSAEERLAEGHALIALIIGAGTDPQHSLYSLSSRYEEFLVVKRTVQHANDLLQSNILELNQWVNLFKKADKVFEKGTLAEITDKICKMQRFTSSIAPVKEHLRKAGQSSLASQCEQIEGQLNKSISRIATSCQSLVDILDTYRCIWQGYPSDHIENHRLLRQSAALEKLSTKLSLESVQAVVGETKQDINNTNALQIDKCISNKITLLTAKLQKACKWTQDNELNDLDLLVASRTEAKAAVTEFSNSSGEQGKNAIVCALLSCLVQSLKMRLNEDRTVASVSQGLSDLVMEDMWWFDESVVSLDMICEVMTQLKEYSPPKSTAEEAVIKSLESLQNVFNALQDLVQNTSQVIVVEGGRLMGIKEKSVLNIACQLRDFVSGVSLPGLLQQLDNHLRLTVFRMASNLGSAVQEANYLHDQLIKHIQVMADVSPFGVGQVMSQGQMLLMGFHLLFETVDSQIDQLIDSITFAVLQPPWQKMDVVRQSRDIMGPIFDPSVLEVVRAILKVKKVQAITTFFTEALQTFGDNKKPRNLSNPLKEENGLTKIVKEYTSECVFRLFLGLPSYLATHLLLLHAQKAGIHVTGYIEFRDIGSDGQVPLDGIVDDALDRLITDSYLQSIISQAADKVHVYLTATKKTLLYKVWNKEINGIRILLERIKKEQISHRWYYEDALKPAAPPLLPSRQTTLSELSSNCDSLNSLHRSMSDLETKYINLIDNIRNRLKWAAGSDPILVQALETFQGTVDENTDLLASLVATCDEIKSLAKGIIRYEKYRMTNAESNKQDELFRDILRKVEESCRVNQLHTAIVSRHEELLISLCDLPSEITSAWIKESTSKVTDHLVSLTDNVSLQRTTLETTHHDVTKDVDQLRHHLITHHKLMSEIRVLLKNLAKYEEEWQIPGIEAYLCLYKRYSETMLSSIRQIVHDAMDLDKADGYIATLQHLLGQTGVIYDNLIDLERHCKPDLAENLKTKTIIFDANPKLAIGVSSRSKPKPAQVAPEHNSYALSVWKRVQMKLDGKDPNSEHISTVQEQVDYSIRESKNLDNLATLYEGWTAWV